MSNQQLLTAGSSTLAYNASGTIVLVVRVTPGDKLGIYQNVATGTGTSPGGTIVTDISTDGTNADPDSDGNPRNNQIPTPVQFTESPEITVVKSSGLVTEPIPGTYALTYTMEVSNTGDIVLNNVQLTDNLSTTFPAPNAVTLVNPTLVSSPAGSGISINPSYNGVSQIQLLNGTGSLLPGQSATISVAIFVNSPGGGNYVNNVLATGVSPAGFEPMDIDTAEVVFDELPEIGIAKSVYSVTDISMGALTDFTVVMQLDIENLGNVDLRNLVVYDDIVNQFSALNPRNFTTLIPSAIDQDNYNILLGNTGWNGTGISNILFSGQELPSQTAGTIWIQFDVTPGTTGSVNNTAFARGTSPAGTQVTDNSQLGLDSDPDNDGDSGDNNVPTPVIFPIGADLKVTKSVSPASPNVGTNVVFKIRIDNLGPVDATGVVVKDTLPNGYTFVSASPAMAYDPLTFTWTVGNLLYQDSAILLITAEVEEPGTGVVYRNYANVSGNETDPILTNNRDDAEPSPVSLPGISIIKSSSLNTGIDLTPSVGDEITYTYVVTNTGNVTLSGVTVTEQAAQFSGTGILPLPVFSSSTLLSLAGTLLVGESATYTATYAITAADILAGIVNNRAIASGNSYSGGSVTDESDSGNASDPNESGDPSDPAENDPTGTLIPSADLQVIKSSVSATYTPGGTVTYTVLVTNLGPFAVSNATFADAAPAGTSITSWTASYSNGSGAASGTGSINELINLSVNGTASYTITLSVLPSRTGDLTNTATITAPAGIAEINTSNNSDSETDTPLYISDLAIVKSSASATFVPGTSVTWTITVTNDGPSDVVNAIVSDNFDSRLTDIQWTAMTTGSASVIHASGSGDIVNELVSIATGGANSVIYTVTADVPSNYSDNFLINTASVEAPAGTSDPDLTNNSDTETDTRLRSADLYVVKNSASASYTPGTNVTYTITVGNNGPSDILAADFADSAPVGTLISNWSASFTGGASGLTSGSGNISQSVSLPVGSTIAYQVVLSVPSNFTGDLINIATIATTGTDTDPDPTNNSDTETDIQAPLAVNDNYYTPFETQTDNQSVTNNDTYPVGSTFSVVSNPTAGNISMASTGVFSYLPPNGFTGVTTFTYQVCLPAPNATVCDTATGTIVVGPQANIDYYSTAHNTPVTSSVISNDIYPSNSTFTQVTQPTNGTVIFSPNGSFTYTPAPGFTGVDSYIYQVCMPAPNVTVCDTAIVKILVGPIAEDDTETTPFGMTLGEVVYNNDTYPTSSVFSLVTDVPLGQGSLTFNADGSYTYDPGTFAGTTTFAYDVCFTSGLVTLCDVATVTITVPCPNLILSVLSFNHPLCEATQSGSITLATTGGSTPYSYTWPHAPMNTSNIASGLAAGTYTVTVTDANGCSGQVSQILADPSGILATISATTNVSCNGGNDGSSAVTGSGGTGTYTYLWNTTPSQITSTASGLVAGAYNVVITDVNGCSAIAFVNITQPTQVVASIASTTNISCNGGSDGRMSVDVTGGVTPYTYSWSNMSTTAVLSGVVAGAYTVTVSDASGCTSTAAATLTEPSGLDITTTAAVVTNPTCNGELNGKIDVTVSGGTVPYTYTWSGGENEEDPSALGAGTYSVTVTDGNGCQIVGGPYTLSSPTLLTATISSTTNPSCEGGTTGIATVTAAGGTATYTYKWSNGATTATATGLGSGTYLVTVTDANGCTAVTSALLSDPTGVTATITASTNVTCNGGNNGASTVTATGGNAPYTYAWSNGQTTATATGLTAGQYLVTVTATGGCSAVALVTITEPTQVLATIVIAQDVSCNEQQDGSATIQGAGGVTPYTYSWPVSAGSQTTNVATNLAVGSYTVTVTDANNCTSAVTVTIGSKGALTIEPISDIGPLCTGSMEGPIFLNAVPYNSTITYSWVGGSLAGIPDLSNCGNLMYPLHSESGILMS